MKTLRVLAGIGALCVACFLVLCTIKNDNGSLAPTGPTGPSGPGTTLAPYLMVVPDSLYVGVKETLAVTVTVMTDSIHNNPLPNARVICTPSGGWVSAETLYTSAKGRVVFKMMDTTKATVNLVFTCGFSNATLSIDVTDTPDKIQKRMLIAPGRAILKADGHDSTAITVTLKDENNNPVAAQCVQFISSAGMIMGGGTGCSGSGQSATDTRGIAQAVLTSAAINDTAFITAYLVSDRTKIAQTRVVFGGVTILLSADSTNLKPSSQTRVTAVLLDGSNQPIPYSQIYFALGRDTASNLSILSKDTITGPVGNAQCLIKGKITGTDSLRVQAAGATSSIRINVTDLSLVISLDDKILQARATQSTVLHAVFNTNSGAPLSGKTVQIKRSYKQSNGADTVDYVFAKTDSTGKCNVAIFALPYECVMTLEVTAFNTTTDLASATTTISFLATRTMVASAVPPIIQADGTSQSTITVQVKSVENNPMVGDQVQFATDAGLVTALATTDDNGKAVALLTSDRRNTIATVRATLVKDPTKFIATSVEFAGVTLTASANPPSINASGKDSSTISITLVDGAKNPIVGEPINFSKTQDSTFLFKSDSVTDNRGDAICKVYGKGSGTDTIKIQAAGASTSVAIHYSSNYLSVDTVGFQPCIADGRDSTEIRISYFGGDKITPVPNATINVSITLGTVNHDTVFAKQFTLIPANNGQILFWVKNPNFANTSTIFAYAKSPSEVTAALFQLYFRSTVVRKIVLTGTPSVIAANGSRAKLTAVAFDSLGNRVRDEQLTFNMFSGPGGGEYLDPPMVITADDGSATSNFVSGTASSTFRGVGVVVSDISGIKSDSVFITIAGPPVNVALGTNILKGYDYGDGTFGLPCAAVITDINGNPVADGTQVTFSLLITGYTYYVLTARWEEQAGVGGLACYWVRDSVRRWLLFEDLNNNFRLDPGEDRNNDGFASRGQDINGDGIYDPGPAYEDINHNGKRDFIFGTAEPTYTCTNGEVKFADLNNNGFWDPVEPLQDTGYLKAYNDLLYRSIFDTIRIAHPIGHDDSVKWAYLKYRDTLYTKGANFIPTLGCYDFYWGNQGSNQPSPAVSIPRTVQTVGGKATNVITYGQSAADKVEVTVWAECQGVICTYPAQQVLPIISTEVGK